MAGPNGALGTKTSTSLDQRVVVNRDVLVAVARGATKQQKAATTSNTATEAVG